MQDETVVEADETMFPNPFYRIRDVASMIGIGKSTIFKYQQLSLFPKPLQLSARLSVYEGKALDHWCKNVAPQIALQSRQPKSQQKTFY